MNKIKTIFWALKFTFLSHPFRTIINLLVTIISSVMPISLTVYIGYTVNYITELLNNAVVDLDNFVFTLINLGILLILNTFFFYGSNIILSALNIKISTQIKERFISAVKNIPIKYFDDTKFCDRFSIAKDGFDNIVSTVDSVFMFIGEIVSFITSIIIITRTSYYLIIPVLCSFVIGFRLNMWSKKIQYNYWIDTTKQRRFSSYISDLFFSKPTAREIRSFKLLDFLFTKWFSINEQLREDSYTIQKKSNKFFAYYQLFMEVSNIVVLIISIIFAKSGLFAIGEIITIWQLNKNILLSVQTINSSYSDLYFNNEKVTEAKSFLYEFSNDKLHEKYYNEKFGTFHKAGGDGNPSEIAYELKNVSFSYIEGLAVLKNINLTIRKGETIAICGENGSGKSTLIKLILGLYSPDQGEIFVFGEKNNNLIIENIGIAFQDYVCYPFSIRENIGFGYLDEINNNNAIKLASKQGGTINLLKKYGIDKLLTKIMDNNGVELSGGEWQKIALSRANMGQKILMIFDEPAAKLDPLSEFKQYSEIQKMMQDRTVILVSHRIGFARLAKRIIVMKDGQVIEDGTHESLISSNGEYKKMFNEQAQWYDTSWSD